MSKSESNEVEAMFYILDTRSVVGNCAMWWGEGGKGYTCDLDKAGLYPKAEGDEMHEMRDTDVPVPQEMAERLVAKHVRLAHVRQNLRMDKGVRR